MPSYFVLRLVPDGATDPTTFESYLAGLTVKVYDISYDNPNGQMVPASVPVTGASVATSVVTLTTTSPNSFGSVSQGDPILVENVDGTGTASPYNGVFVCTAVSALSLTYTSGSATVATLTTSGATVQPHVAGIVEFTPTPPMAVTAKETSSVVTLTGSFGFVVSAGEPILVQGVGLGYNGIFTCTTATPTTLTYLGTGTFTSTPTAGTVQPLPFQQHTDTLGNPASVATAIIPVPPPSIPEDISPSIQVEFDRGTQVVLDPNTYYEVALYAPAGPIPAYQDIPAGSVSAYVTLPTPGVAASVSSQPGGAPPSFAALLAAIQTVLTKDPSPPQTPTQIAGLSAAQCQNIAYEIIYGAPATLPSASDTLENMYTSPINDGSLSNAHQQNLSQFQGGLTSYYATKNAAAAQLAKFVVSVSAAMACELHSTQLDQAIVTFPVNPGAPNLANVPDASVIFTGVTGKIDVPAEVFYVLTANLPMQVTAAQRFKTVTAASQSQNLAQLTDAVNSGLMSSASPAGLFTPFSTMTAAQATRTLGALAVPSPTTIVTCSVAATAPISIAPIWTDWLLFPTSQPPSYTYQPGDDLTVFWPAEAASNSGPFLNLVLWVFTQGDLVPPITGTPLATTIITTLKIKTLIFGTSPPIAAVGDLVQALPSDWQTFFTSSGTILTKLLPPFTLPGSPSVCLATFISDFQTFFGALGTVTGPAAATAPTPPSFNPLVGDLISATIAKIEALTTPNLTFPLNSAQLASLTSAAVAESGGDAQDQAWIIQAITAINELATLTAAITPPSLQFSVMEALFARGFTSSTDVLDLPSDDFQEALTGTVAYDFAPTIYGKPNPSTPPGTGNFTAVNPGSLTDCIPPLYLSPLGPIAYLSEMLRVSEQSTCDNPIPDAQGSLGAVIAQRRGPIDKLLVTRANLETPLPLIDIVNECLESAAHTHTAIGTVYNTAQDELAGHTLAGDCVEGHDLATLFAALPEFSTPGTPSPSSELERLRAGTSSNSEVEPAVFDTLAGDFSSCCLPYSQALDVSRTYLEYFRTCRFEVMRTFRKCITEYVFAPATPPTGFRSYLWRYPVRIEIAIEYLKITPNEYAQLFGGAWLPACDSPAVLEAAATPAIAAQPTIAGTRAPSYLYGFGPKDQSQNPDQKPDNGWTSTVAQLPEFLKRTCLTYCEFLDLWKCGFVDFSNADDPSGSFPDCEPCCLGELRLTFPDAQVEELSPETLFYQLAVFIRLWRKLKGLCGCGYSFQQLADICGLFPLFPGNVVNPDFIRQLVAFQMLRDQLGLPLTDERTSFAPGMKDIERTRLLALWYGQGCERDWALEQFIEGIAHYAICRFKCERREPEFLKHLAEKLDCLARLAGFNPDIADATWHVAPTYTLRFAEVLAKIYASKFSIGEILLLFADDDCLCEERPRPAEEPRQSHDDDELPCEGLDDEPEHRPEHDHEGKHRHSRRRLRWELFEKHFCQIREEDEDCTLQEIERELRQAFDSAGTPPSLAGQQAMFDCWERIFDFKHVRKELHEDSGCGLRLFHDQSVAVYTLTEEDLDDDRWLVRAAQAGRWMQSLKRCFRSEAIAEARPDLWASNDLAYALPGETEAGNANLSRFVGDGCLESGAPRLYDELKELNDGLRERGRCALITYLCGANGILGVSTPKDLSDRLLLDVETGLCEKASRVEEAITAVQTFIQRCRIGLETTCGSAPTWMITPQFAHMWDSRFVSYHVWQACKRRELFKENWIDWHELERAKKIESFRFMDEELRRVSLTIAAPGGVDYWPEHRPPAPGLCLLQDRDPATMQLLTVPREGLGLFATPGRDGRPSWITTTPPPVTPSATTPPPSAPGNLPFWMECAIKLGTRFVRVSAAGYPPASTHFEPWQSSQDENCVECCAKCGCRHAAHVDEYYFWLVDGRHFDPQNQGAGYASFDAQQKSYYDPTPTVQESLPWHDVTQLPNLLAWPSDPMVRVAWCCRHDGEFLQARVSAHGIVGGADIGLLGRAGDSLYFAVPGSTPSSGFRFDLAVDEAHVVENISLSLPPTPPASALGGLMAYPYFAYYQPGARLFPWSMYSPAIAVANALRSHCRFEAALKWYDLYYDPLCQDNTWTKCVDTQPPNTCCDSTNVSCQVARQRSVLLHYVETLVEWGDALMRHDSPERLQQARVIFDSARRILGKTPRKVRNPATVPPTAATVGTFTSLTSLWAPINPRLMMLYDRVDDRMALIHHCQSKHRLRQASERQDSQYWGNDPVRDGWRSNLHQCCEEGDSCHPHSPYRFTFLIQKAKELANQTRELGAALLAAFEKGDTEYLASVRAVHERELLVLGRKIREGEWRDGDFTCQSLYKTKQSDQVSYVYYDTLIANNLISDENNYVDQTDIALIERAVSNGSEAVAEILTVIPDFWVGTCSSVQPPAGTKAADLFKVIARIMTTFADIASTTASLDLTRAGWCRRMQDWRHQRDILRIQIEGVELQILGAERRRHDALQTLNNFQRQIEQSTEVLDFLRDKFTNHAVYLFLQKNTADLHYQMYDLALSAAREAERAFHVERGHDPRKFICCEGWDNLHEGLLAGERLQLSLAQMEKEYCDRNRREYELTKHISLRLQFPMEFLRLKITGHCEIEIPEWMFDMDYPGQFMRRIKDVSVTIPSVSGPYNGVHCRLTLLRSTTRIDPLLSLAPARCCSKCKSGNAYEACPHDPRVVTQYAATEAIETSTGQNDSGLFEMNIHDERYLPFEYHGVVSKWRIEMPPQNNYFDMDTLSDFIVHLNYTAREGGERLRHATQEAVEKRLPGAGWCLFDVQHDFPDAWELFRNRSGQDDKRPRHLNLKFSRNLFPFLPGHREIHIDKMALLFDTCEKPPCDCCAGECACGPSKTRACWPVGFKNHRDDCEETKIVCAASGDWSDFYHGVFDAKVGPLGRNGARPEARFRFPSEVGETCQMFLLCRYEVAPRLDSNCRPSPAASAMT